MIQQKRMPFERIEHHPESQSPSPYDKVKRAVIVQGISGNRIFHYNKYEFLDENLLENANGKKLFLKDVKVGSLIEYIYRQKSIEERGDLAKIVVHDDELSTELSASLRNFINHQKAGVIHNLYLYSVNDEQLLLKFRVGKEEPQYNAVIDRKTNDFTIEKDQEF